MFNVTTFDAVIRKLIYVLWRRPSCYNSSNFVHNLFTRDIFFQSCLNAGDNYCSNFVLYQLLYFFLPREALLSAIFAHFADAISSVRLSQS